MIYVKLGVFIVLSAMMFLVSGCQKEGGQGENIIEKIKGVEDAVNPERTVAVIFDTTEEKEIQKYIDQYENEILKGKAVKGFTGNDTLIVTVLDDNPLESDDNYVVIKFAGQSRDARAARDNATDGVKQLIEKHEAPKNRKIMENITQVGQLIQQHKSDENYLVIFSSMLEKSTFIDKTSSGEVYYDYCRDALRLSATVDTSPCLAQNKKCSYCEAIIEEERDKQRLADLSDVNIYVAGARSCNINNNNEFRFIKNCWGMYFDAVNAEYASSDYGATLSDFP